jgi:hypothetical protein
MYTKCHLFHHFFVGSSILTSNHEIWVIVDSVINGLCNSDSLIVEQET